MSTALAVPAECAPVALPDLREAHDEIARLVADEQADALDEVRRRAEAMALYEKRDANRNREAHFAKLRLLAEAGLGVLTFDSPAIAEKLSQRSDWRALAAAFERGQLLQICAGAAERQGLATTTIVGLVRYAGWTYVPGKALGVVGKSVPWREARLLARQKGIDPAALPSDAGYIRRREHEDYERAQRLRRAFDARDRLDRMKRRDELRAVAREHGPGIDKAYALLRQTMQALHDAQAELSPLQRGNLDHIFAHFHGAEDALGEMLRLP